MTFFYVAALVALLIFSEGRLVAVERLEKGGLGLPSSRDDGR